MSDNDREDGLPLGGRRKDGRPFAPGNQRADGSYGIGKYRPPQSSQFQAGDGRPRGRKPKGSKHFDTEFAEEAARIIPIKENGKIRRVSKRRASLVRLFDNANTKGQNAAIATVISTDRMVADRKAATAARKVIEDDLSILDAYIRDRAAVLGINPDLFGDPPGHPEDMDDDSGDASEKDTPA